MAHCPFEKLDDLSSDLEVIRKWPGIKETKPGIFYLGSRSFLHFHIKGARRWADARDGKGWGTEIEIPLDASRKQKEDFLKKAMARHSRTLSYQDFGRVARQVQG